jgi:Uma2 family endonuclease
MTQIPLTPLKWTLEDYHRMIEAGILSDRHVELLNGEIIEMSPEGIPHANLCSETGDYLRELLGKRVKIRDSKPITLPNASEPEPDICICQPISYATHHPYPEDIFWLIEYSDSSLNKDLETKSLIYATANIPEYWVVNLKSRKLIVFRDPIDGEYQQKQTFSQGTINSLAFPDISISINRLVG